MTAASPRLVIFDCDGTLVDSRQLITAALGGAFAALGAPAPPHDRMLSIFGLSLVEAMAALMPGMGASEHRRLAEAYRRSFQALLAAGGHAEPLFEGAREAILSLAARGDILLGIATGKSRRGVLRLLENHGLAQHFTTIQTADDAPSKPHPAMVEQAMAETQVRPEATAVVGDTVFDIQMARAAGAGAIGVAWGYHPPAARAEAGAHAMLAHFKELETLLETVWQSVEKVEA
jgi:phosphoglycolate phosphatase